MAIQKQQPAGEGSPGSRKLYFLHIPKTAGTTLTRWLTGQYLPEEVFPHEGWSPKLLEDRALIKKCRFFHGHLCALFTQFFDSPPDVITILRDPVGRLRSDIAHARREALHPLFRLLNDHKDTDWASMPEFSDVMANCQVQSLSASLGDGAEVHSLMCQPPERIYQEVRRSLQSVPTRDDLGAAIELIKNATAFGFQESLDDLIFDLASHLQRPVPESLPYSNTAPARLDPAPPLDYELELTQLDQELCSFARLEQKRRGDNRSRDLHGRALQSLLEQQSVRLDSPFTLDMKTPFFGDGWWPAEHLGEDMWIRWTYAERARIDLPLSIPKGSSVRIVCRFFAQRERVQEFQLYANDVRLPCKMSTASEDGRPAFLMEAKFPKQACSRTTSLVIQYRPVPWSVLHPETQDHTCRGLALSKILITPPKTWSW